MARNALSSVTRSCSKRRLIVTFVITISSLVLIDSLNTVIIRKEQGSTFNIVIKDVAAVNVNSSKAPVVDAPEVSLANIQDVSEAEAREMSEDNEQEAKPVTTGSFEDTPGKYLNSLRFDVIVKSVYAYYFSVYKFVPEIFVLAYTEHLRVWNHFQERCKNTNLNSFDARIPCKDKRSKEDFISSFHNTISSIQKQGFVSNTSRIPVGENNYILNGAHRLATAIVLSKNVTFQYISNSTTFPWDYFFFKKRGLQSNVSDLVMLEWMKIQRKIPKLETKVSMLSIFSESREKDDAMRKIVKEKCSKDKGILYEKSILVNKLGMTQLIRHMYGNQSWLAAKVQTVLNVFKLSNLTVLFIFFFEKSLEELKECKYEIRKLYNHKHFKSSAHIPDSPDESLILAEMILNPNSVQFLNFGVNGLDCQGIATELARRVSFTPVDTLPGLYIGRGDLMFDSGSVLHLFNLRNRTDVDMLFLHNIDKRILGNKNGFNIEAHAFKSNAISSGRPWGEDHFSETVKTKWDLFNDPKNYGFCYGIKFVSLEQLVRYKTKRNEPQKDQKDVNLIKGLLHTAFLE